MSIKKVLIVSAGYNNDYGYQENAIEMALKRMSFSVDILDRISGLVLQGNRIERRCSLFDLYVGRYRHRWDYYVIVGQSTLLSFLSCVLIRAEKHTLCIMGDNYGYARYRRRGYLRNAIYDLRKRVSTRVAFACCYSVVGTTPDTWEIVSGYAGRNITRHGRKYRFVGLGVDPVVYKYSEEKRSGFRSSNGFTEQDYVVAIATIIRKEDKISSVVRALYPTLMQGKRIKLVIAGVANEEAEAAIMHAFHKAVTNLTVLPVQTQEELSSLFCGVDVVIWQNAAITIQQALATGVHVILPELGSLRHLQEYPEVSYYKANDDAALAAILEQLRSGNQNEDRCMRSQSLLVELSYDSKIRTYCKEVSFG
jgi:hypothetical protein